MAIFTKTPPTHKAQTPDITLETERLIIRPPKAEDCEQWIAVRSQSENSLKPFEPHWPENCLTPAFFHKRLHLQAQHFDIGAACYFLIFKKNPDRIDNKDPKTEARLIGGVNINDIRRNVSQFANLGYWLCEKDRGQGYMIESIGSILQFCFMRLNLNRVNAACIPRNTSSKNVLENSGFIEEGFAKSYLKINGNWEDHILYGMTYDHWLELDKQSRPDFTLPSK